MEGDCHLHQKEGTDYLRTSQVQTEAMAMGVPISVEECVLMMMKHMEVARAIRNAIRANRFARIIRN